MPESREKDWVSVERTATILRSTQQNVYELIKRGRLSCRKKDGTLTQVYLPSIDNYLQNKFSREYAKVNGELVYDLDKGRLSVLMVAKMLKITPQRVYYLIRHGVIKAEKRGWYTVVHQEDLERDFKIKNIEQLKIKFG